MTAGESAWVLETLSIYLVLWDDDMEQSLGYAIRGLEKHIRVTEVLFKAVFLNPKGPHYHPPPFFHNPSL